MTAHGPRPTVGVIDLRRHEFGSARELTDLLEAQGHRHTGQTHRSFALPDRVLLIGSSEFPSWIVPHAGWIGTAASVVVARELDGSIRTDPELNALEDAEWDELTSQLGNVEARIDFDVGTPEVLQEALDRVLGSEAAPWRVEEPLVSEANEWPGGTWVPFTKPIRLVNLPPIVCTTPTGPALFVSNVLHSLVGPRVEAEALTLPFPPVSLSPDLTVVLMHPGRLVSRDGRTLHEPPVDDRGRPVDPVGWTVGFDPLHPVAFTGYRCVFRWNLLTNGTLVQLCQSGHDWPCGHANKHWGYDNRPISVALAPDMTAYVSSFEQDTLISSDVPVRWLAYGDLAVACAPSTEDPLRALFFCTDETSGSDPIDPSEEDCRAFGPVVVLGPDAACRYAVDLGHPTWRIRKDRSERIDDGAGGYTVYGADHAPVRQARGRLLGGWFRFATILDDDQLWREDLKSGERMRLGPADREITSAVAVPGTRNVVLVSSDAVRLV